jgi:AraC family transcriptional regulator, regulatory protein of adaptative response / methylated-DNA-[protein]-cysteine methyltransferase
MLYSHKINTPIGAMLAISDKEVLYLLEFLDCKKLDNKIGKLKQKLGLEILFGVTEPIKSIEKELSLYFMGKLKQFKAPVKFLGTPFQNNVWQQLMEIPCGKTWSYLDLAKVVNNPKGFRAVALANSKNQMPIIVPCHRVINSNGKLGGYAGGLSRKQWLLRHEE